MDEDDDGDKATVSESALGNGPHNNPQITVQNNPQARNDEITTTKRDYSMHFTHRVMHSGIFSRPDGESFTIRDRLRGVRATAVVVAEHDGYGGHHGPNLRTLSLKETFTHMRWVKLFTAIHMDRDFLRLSERARHTFLDCIVQAGACDKDGRLAGRTGGFTPAEIRFSTGIDTDEAQLLALTELVRSGFMTFEDETWIVKNFMRWNAVSDPTGAERQKRFRDKKRGAERNGQESEEPNGDESQDAITLRNGYRREEHSIEEPTKALSSTSRLQSNKLRADKTARQLILESPAIPAGLAPRWPSDLNELKKIAMLFLAAFGNCTTEVAIKKHGPAYVVVLKRFQQRGASPSEAWSAMAEAWMNGGGRPLFAAKANEALSFLPQRTGNGQPDARKPAQHFPKVDDLIREGKI